jgi:hypothetical protein
MPFSDEFRIRKLKFEWKIAYEVFSYKRLIFWDGWGENKIWKRNQCNEIKLWLWMRCLQSICIFLLMALPKCSYSCCKLSLIGHDWKPLMFSCILRIWRPWSSCLERGPIFWVCGFVFIGQEWGEGYLVPWWMLIDNKKYYLWREF